MAEFDRTAFIGRFQEEASDLLQRLNEGVITLEGTPDDRELIDQMLRDAHTLKGSSRMVGLIDISDIAHRLEDVMVAVRDGRLAYTPDMSDRFFESLDTIVYLAERAASGEPHEVDLDGVRGRLEALAETGCEDEVDTAAGEPTPVPDEGVRSGGAPPNGSSGAGNRAACEELVEVKAKNTIRVRSAQVDTLLNLISEAVISHTKYEERVHEARQARSGTAGLWREWRALKRAIDDAARGLDAVSSGQLAQAIGAFEHQLSHEHRRQAAFATDLGEDVARGSALVDEIQERGMELRMLPVSTVFSTFPRAVRDLARSFNKQVELVLEGGETELDKKVLESINDPLVHIMRNAIDHGIETPDERDGRGKPPVGTIRVSARQEGDHIVIEVADDGAGIDTAAVRASAVRKGYLSEAEAAAMSEREAMLFIFERGFSTSPIITEISGRGVGMDVVHEYIVERLRGDLNVFSTPGEGTTFRLVIPLTMAAIRAVMVRVGKRVCAMPTSSIEETVLVERDDVVHVENREAIRRGHRTIPLVTLADVLGVDGDGGQTARFPVVVIGSSGHRMGFVTDEVIEERQIVIKPLGDHLRAIDNVAGVTVFGAGEIVPILNVPDLMANARAGGRKRAEDGVEQLTPPAERTVLICEDSFTTRELERSIFEAAGYRVEAVSDGAQGLELLRRGLDVHAVVTDVQMPEMTGFELTRAIKSDPELSAVPVVIVTSLEREEEKAEGIAAGADAYITKSVFNQDTLLDTVDRLMR